MNALLFNMILGLEWLKENKIVMDMGEHSVVAKLSAYIYTGALAQSGPMYMAVHRVILQTKK
jgi:hypothetical protein